MKNIILDVKSVSKKVRCRHLVKEVLDIVGLTGRENDKVRTYSLGMKQRLGIAQALLGDPDLLILDEPANGLDPMGVRELRELLFTLKRDYNKTILISSHLLDELQRVCDQIVVMREGELIWEGALDQLASGKNLEDASRTSGHGNLDLGLYIAHSIVKNHGGSITADNKETGGALFKIVLPMGKE
ncbi:ATP-binding cassette domain-containing protein [Priestia megaterium]